MLTSNGNQYLRPEYLNPLQGHSIEVSLRVLFTWVCHLRVFCLEHPRGVMRYENVSVSICIEWVKEITAKVLCDNISSKENRRSDCMSRKSSTWRHETSYVYFSVYWSLSKHFIISMTKVLGSHCLHRPCCHYAIVLYLQELRIYFANSV